MADEIREIADAAGADDDSLHEECGVFGVYGHPDSAALVALGLHALQHRGQEAAGIVAYDGEQFHAHRGMGLVGENFSSKDVMAKLKGGFAIGHVRYATTGEVAPRNIQPLFADFAFGGLAIYRRAILSVARYAGADENGEPICEHVPLHKLLRARGARIFINPRFINTSYTENSRQRTLTHILKRGWLSLLRRVRHGR